MSEIWKNKLTEFDYGLCKMVKAITEKECEPQNGGDHYFIEADYSNRTDPRFVLAVWDAICGRAGNRLVSIEDDPERKTLNVKIKFDADKDRDFITHDMVEQSDRFADTYCKQMGEVKALQVTRANGNRLIEFVGNGTLVIERKPGGMAWFEFLNAESVYCKAMEWDYIVYVSPGRFKVVARKEFEKEFEPK